MVVFISYMQLIGVVLLNGQSYKTPS